MINYCRHAIRYMAIVSGIISSQAIAAVETQKTSSVATVISESARSADIAAQEAGIAAQEAGILISLVLIALVLIARRIKHHE